MHLGGDSFTEGVDVTGSATRPGRASAAITELVPAAELVRRFVAEADEVLRRLAAIR